MKTELQTFNAAMGAILRSDPKAVKAAVDETIRENKAERESRGERKRGRKPRRSSISDHVSSDKG